MFPRRRWIGLLTVLAVAFPVPTLAQDGAAQAPSVAVITVSASLSHCDGGGSAILCTVNASWNAVDYANIYSVSVRRPDGSVVGLGASSATSTSVLVPYVGSGSYSVIVEAWGTPPRR